MLPPPHTHTQTHKHSHPHWVTPATPRRPQISAWLRILVTRAVALVPTLAVAALTGGGGTGLDKLNQLLNLLQSVQLPFA